MRTNNVQELIEYYNGKSWYDLVLEFHEAFGHPAAFFPVPMPIERRIDRAKWITEEMWEFVSASDSDIERQVDALIDALYFIIGTYVEIGYDPYIKEEFLKDGKGYEHGFMVAFPNATDTVDFPPNPMPRDMRIDATIDYNDYLFEFMSERSYNVYNQTGCLSMLMEWVYTNLARLGVNPSGIFEAVHEANMSKLWADGKPKYRDDGKIRKPNGWESSRNAVQTELMNRTEQYYKDEEVPF